MLNIDDMPRLEGQLDSSPELVVLVNATRLVIQNPEVAASEALSDDHPHSFDLWRIAADDGDRENQFRKVARLQDFPNLRVWNLERRRRHGVELFAVFKLPAIGVQIW
jgi:hypothetical protein